MLSRSLSVALVGTEARLVEVEVDVGSNGLPGLALVGLPAKSVREAEHRVRSAIISGGRQWPQVRIVANLAPGALRKEGTHFDLAIALGVLAGDGAVPKERLQGWVAVGELALDGTLRAVPGVLAAAIACRKAGRRGLICPVPNAPEARLVEGVDVVAVSELKECIGFLHERWEPPAVVPLGSEATPVCEDMSEVRGHAVAKRAAEIAAAGGHNLLLSGPPGSGKTMLARRLPGILPPLSPDESLEVTRVYSVAGLLRENSSLVRQRPFRAPHHHISQAGLIGGGSGMARPGEISLAHHGTLFLDELALYRREALESLRGPLEDGVVRIARSGGTISYPCRFSLIGAMNPCPCGHSGDDRKPCRCTAQELARYRARLSGPLLDRIDVQVALARSTRKELLGAPEGESSAAIRGRVEAARAIQTERYGSSMVTNASCTRAQLDSAVQMNAKGREMLGLAIDSLMLSARGLARVLRISRTIADLAGDAETTVDHIAEALSLRLLEAHEGAAA